MSPRPRTPRRIGLALAATSALALVLGWLPLTPVAAAASDSATDRVQVQVLAMSPTTPAVTTTPAILTIQLQLTNTTASTIRKLTVLGVRGDPIDNRTALAAAIAKPTLPAADDPQPVDITTRRPVSTSLGPHETKTITYTTTTSTVYGTSGICLCENRIYPLFLEATATSKARGTVVLGSAQTFIPSFGTAQPKPMQVSWVWPLLERPHRNTAESIFTDDALATSIAGGRLDRLLQTVQLALQQNPSLSMTLLVDPDLIDELAVMAAGSYQVQGENGTTTAGAGTSAAGAGLARLRTCLAEGSNLQLGFTPFADRAAVARVSSFPNPNSFLTAN